MEIRELAGGLKLFSCSSKSTGRESLCMFWRIFKICLKKVATPHFDIHLIAESMEVPEFT